MTAPTPRPSFLAAVLLAALAGPVSAQSAEDPRLVFTTFGGYIGGGSLWQVNRQVVPVTSNLADTLTLGRVFKPGFALGLGIQLYRSPHLGYSLEMAFLGTNTESRCSPVSPFVPDPLFANQRSCRVIQGRSLRTNAVAVQAGIVWRPLARGIAQPYLRASGGPAILGGSFIDTKAELAVGITDSAGQQTLLEVPLLLGNDNSGVLTWTATAAAGVTLELAPGYQVRFEARDVILSVPYATGPATMFNPSGYVAPSAMKTVHLPSLTVGFDIVLERQRRRRY